VKREFVPRKVVRVTPGAKHLKGGQQTSVEVVIDGSKAPEGRPLKPGVHPGEVHVVLVHSEGHRVELPRQYFEVWVHQP